MTLRGGRGGGRRVSVTMTLIFFKIVWMCPLRQSWYQYRTNDGMQIEPSSKDQSMGADEDDMLCVFDKQLRDDIVLANCCSINFMLCMQ